MTTKTNPSVQIEKVKSRFIFSPKDVQAVKDKFDIEAKWEETKKGETLILQHKLNPEIGYATGRMAVMMLTLLINQLRQEEVNKVMTTINS